MLDDPYRPEFMAEGKFLQTSEFAVGEGSSTGMVGAVSVRCDASGGPVAGIGRFGPSFGAVDVVVGPVGRD